MDTDTATDIDTDTDTATDIDADRVIHMKFAPITDALKGTQTQIKKQTQQQTQT